MRLSERALVELRKFDAHSPKVEFGKHIGQTFFETNHFDRPELTRFVKIRGRKTLVIQRYENLTEFGGEEVNNFCRAAYLEFWPIIDVNDAHFPITRSIMNDTRNLPQYLMQNQDKVRSRIIGRMEQHHIPRGFGRFGG